MDALKKSWLIPAIVVLLVVFAAVKKFDFSFTNFVADKVIERLNADYSPYGPTDPAGNVK